MDVTFAALLARQRAARFAGLSGSDVHATLRISAALLHEVITSYIVRASAVRQLTVVPRAGNRFDVHLKLTKPALMPAINLVVTIERQPELPQNATLVLHVSGGGPLLLFAGSTVNAFLPPGVRLDGDRITMDLREGARARGHAEVFEYLQDLAVATEEGTALLLVHIRVP